MPLPESITSSRTGADHRADHVELHKRFNQVFDVTDPAYGAVANGTTDDVAAIQAAIDAAGADGGGIVWFPKGTYRLTASVVGIAHLVLLSDNVWLRGAPGAILYSTENYSTIFLCGAGKPAGVAAYEANQDVAATAYTMNGPVAKGATSITLATAAQAANFAAGDECYIRTGQTLPGTTSNPDAEINMITGADAGTGVLTLAWPTAKPYAQEYFISGTTGLTSTAVTANAAIFGVAKITDRIIRNIRIEDLGFVSTGDKHVLVGGWARGYRVTGNTVETAIGLQSQGHYQDVQIVGNRVRVTGTGAQQYSLTADVGSSDVLFQRNVISGACVVQAHVHEGPSRVKILDNTFLSRAGGSDQNAISFRARGYDNEARGNTIVNAGTSYAIYVDGTCTGGGTIVDNRIHVTSGEALGVAATGWRVDRNESNAVQSLFAPVYASMERLAVVVKSDDQNPSMGTLPAYTYVTNVRMDVETAFNSDGTDNVRVGYDADDDAFATDTDVSATGVKTPTLGVLAGYNNTARDVEAYYVNGGSEPTVGKAVVVLEYYRVQRVT